MSKIVAGIDVSKARLDVAVHGKGKGFSVPNNPEGFAKLVERFRAEQVQLCVLEATGGLERACLNHLQSHEFAVAMVNPRQARDFARSMGQLAKSDDIDARVLARFGQAMEPRPSAKLSEHQAELSAVMVRREQLTQMRTAENNRLHACYIEALRAKITKSIEWLDKRIAEADAWRDRLIAQDEKLTAKAALLQSIPGVGPATSAAVVADLPELDVMDRKQAASLVGVAPHCRDSGQTRGQRMIWGGRAQVRSKLYMAALVATQCNPLIRQFYQGLVARGKAKKVALVACMRKLLGIMRAMLASNTPWNPEYFQTILSTPSEAAAVGNVGNRPG